jgi:hypothetical protein
MRNWPFFKAGYPHLLGSSMSACVTDQGRGGRQALLGLVLRLNTIGLIKFQGSLSAPFGLVHVRLRDGPGQGRQVGLVGGPI